MSFPVLCQSATHYTPTNREIGSMGRSQGPTEVVQTAVLTNEGKSSRVLETGSKVPVRSGLNTKSETKKHACSRRVRQI